MISRTLRQVTRQRRHERVREKISGTAERPRLCVYRSLSHIYAQVVDDVKGITLASASSLDKEIKDKLANGGNKDAASEVSRLVAARAKEKGISAVVFDRGGYIYHGRVKSLAEAAREAGLQF